MHEAKYTQTITQEVIIRVPTVLLLHAAAQDDEGTNE